MPDEKFENPDKVQSLLRFTCTSTMFWLVQMSHITNCRVSKNIYIRKQIEANTTKLFFKLHPPLTRLIHQVEHKAHQIIDLHHSVPRFGLGPHQVTRQGCTQEILARQQGQPQENLQVEYNFGIIQLEMIEYNHRDLSAID